ncbi:unnamed protein product [Closterium sp. NIES-64]|nr:unnamed protein product [Closterium sp. NIES-64]
MWDGEEEDDDRVCHTRAEYRAGRRERAVRVYTVNDESRYLMVRNVPALGCVDDLLRLFSAHGPVEEHRMMDEEDAPPFTDVVWLKFTHLHHARFAKRKLDEYPFMGSALKVSYLPGHEAMEDTWAKLEERGRIVAIRCRRLAEEQAGLQTGGGQDDSRARHREAPAGMGDTLPVAATSTAAASPAAALASRAAAPVAAAAAAAAAAGSIPPLAPLPPPRPQAPTLPLPSAIPALTPHSRLQPAQPHQQPTQPHQQLAQPHQQHVAAAGTSSAINTDSSSDMIIATSSRDACSTAATSNTPGSTFGTSTSDTTPPPHAPCYFGVASMDAAVARVRSHLAVLHAPPHPHSTPPITDTARDCPAWEHGIRIAHEHRSDGTEHTHAREAHGSCPASVAQGMAGGESEGVGEGACDAGAVPEVVRAPAVVLQTHSQCAPRDSASERAVVGGQWPPFWLHGKLPRKSPKGGAQELTLCRVYKERTCCGRENSDHALISTRRLVVGGEPTDDCIAKWEALQCATCHPLIGTQHGPPAICNSFCDAVFSACGSAFFAADGTSQHIFPCGRRDTLCARADSLASSGRQFCQLAGFDWLPDSHGAGVQRGGGRGEEMGGREDEEGHERVCFDGTLPSAAAVVRGRHKGAGRKGEKGSGEEEEAEEEGSGWWEQWAGGEGGRPFGGSVVWMVCGLVLTAGLSYMRWVAARSRRRRLFMGLVKRVGGGGRQQQLEVVRARQQKQLDEAAATAASPTSTTTASAAAATTTARSTARQPR